MRELPTTAEDAIAQGYAFYRPVENTCPLPFPLKCKHNAGHGTSQCDGIAYYAVSKQPICYAKDAAIIAYNSAVEEGEPLNPSQAIAQGKDYFWTPSIGRTCGHWGVKTIDGKCYVCKHNKQHKPKSPRQKALDAGEMWYMPEANDPCPNGHVALRRVNNGSCSQCEADRTAKAAANTVQPIHRMYPDMVISYEDAKALGFKTYRTGEPCKHGHRGWRWISTRTCLECMGRN